ncbi:MAG: hypothetical protein AB8G86_04495 [Saprospiraceae bacterium]
MKKAIIDVSSVISTLGKTIAELKEGIPNAKLSKKAKKEIKEDLEEVIAMAEALKNKNATT